MGSTTSWIGWSFEVKISESHNRTLLRDLSVTYTNGQKRYLSAVGCDYEAYRLCYHIYLPPEIKISSI